MKFSRYVFAVLFAATASTQLAWSGDTKTYPPRDYFDTHPKTTEPVSSEDRTTASVSKDDSASVSDVHEGTGPAGKSFDVRQNRF